MSPPTMLDEALALARNGWAVLPLHSIKDGRCTCKNGAACDKPGKHPRCEHGVNDASRDEKTIREWWRRWPDANIGGATGGPSGVDAIDEDEPGALDALARVHGEIPRTVEAITGGLGRHILFSHDGCNLPNKVRFAAGLDVRSTGGYVVLAPSKHMSGRRYCWNLDRHPDDVRYSPMPTWLSTLIVSAGRRAKNETAAAATGDSIAEGTRNAALVSLAGTMRRRGMTATEINTALSAVNLARCRPPLPGSEVEAIALSIVKYPPGGHLGGHQPEAATGSDREGGLSESTHPHRGQMAPAGDPPEYALSDDGNALRFVADHGDRVRYDHTARRWLLWDGRRWRRDGSEEATEYARETTRKIALEAAVLAGTTDPQTVKRSLALAKHALKSQHARRIAGCLELARSDRRVELEADGLDVDPFALNVLNGTVDLRTGELRPHRREDLLTHLVPIEYDPAALYPRFERFLLEILVDDAGRPDVALFDYIQKAVGYSLTAAVSEQVFFLCHGVGANGKSTFLELLRTLCGDLAHAAAFETLLTRKQDSGISEDLAAMRGKRLVTAAEADAGRSLSESKIKTLTGGDTVRARFLYSNSSEFSPTFKLWLAANHRPRIRGTDEAIWRRVHLIPFRASFPEGRRDPALPAKLRAELPGILRWAVEGTQRWIAEGLGAPAAVKTATKEYRVESDTLAEFLEECCILGPNATATAADLYRGFRSWSEARGEAPMTQRALGLQLKERPEGFMPCTFGHAKTRGWRGLGLRSEARLVDHEDHEAMRLQAGEN